MRLTQGVAQAVGAVLYSTIPKVLFGRRKWCIEHGAWSIEKIVDFRLQIADLKKREYRDSFLWERLSAPIGTASTTSTVSTI